MDTLLKPDTGLIIWTIITFVVLVAVLAKTTWKPILSGLQSREDRIRNDLARAERAQKEAEAMRAQYETQVAEAQRKMQEMVTAARADAERTRAQLVADARAEADRLLEKGRADLNGEAERLKGELRQEVGGLAVAAAEKILGRAVDPKMQEDVLSESLSGLKGVSK